MLALLALTLSIATSGLARAHPLAPALLEVVERPGAHVEVAFRQPATRVPGVALEPRLPSTCRRTSPVRVERDGAAVVERFEATCGPGGLIGSRLAVAGLAASPTDVLLRVVLGNGDRVQAVLSAARPDYLVPAHASRIEVSRQYATLGVTHIAGGFDHLLFVLGLLMLVAGDVRRLLLTVTAFTVGHSVTLSLAVLGVVRFPTGAIELAIALSVFLLAVELCRSPAERPSPLRRFPWLMAGGFGLLHGFGFAGALARVGLPDAEIPLALLAFNGARAEPIYALGTLAAFWCLERVVALLS